MSSHKRITQVKDHTVSNQVLAGNRLNANEPGTGLTGEALENARLYAAEHRRAEQFRVIAEIGRRLTLILDLDELLKQVVSLIYETFGYYHVAIGLIKGDEVVYQYGAGEIWQQPDFHLVPSLLKIGREGLSGWVAAHGAPVNVPDVTQDPRYVAIEGTRAGSELIVPIIVKEQVVGTLDVLRDRICGFDDTDLLVMQSLAHQVGAAIENARLFQAEKRRAEQFRVIAEIGRRLTQVLDLDELLIEVVTLIQQALGYYYVEIGLIEDDEVVYRHGAGVLWNQPGFHLNPSRVKVGKEGLSGWAAATGEAVYVPDVKKEPRYLEIEGSQGRSELVIPIIVKEQVIGVLNALSDCLNGFDDTDLLVMQSLAHQVGAAIENARLFQAEKQRAEQEERSRLARELHDAVTQTLFSASLIAEAVPGVWEKDQRQGRELLQELRSLSRGALAEMRTLLLELRPAALVETRLEDLLHQLGEAASGREGIPVKVLVEGKGTLPPEVHVALYRIAQEALNNVVKHARAGHATVRLCYNCGDLAEGRQRKCVLLSVLDNGRGFDLNQAPHHRLGLGIMQERADGVGANLFIDSQLGEGTQVSVMWEEVKGGGMHE
jgi:signal transduction histidine kinase